MVRHTTFLVLIVLALQVCAESNTPPSTEKTTQSTTGSQSPTISNNGSGSINVTINTPQGLTAPVTAGLVDKMESKKALDTVGSIGLVNFTSLSEGSPVGNGLIVKMHEDTKIKFLSGHTSAGLLKIPVDLHGNYDIKFKLDLKSAGYGLDDHDIFLNADEYSFHMSLGTAFLVNGKRFLTQGSGWQESNREKPVVNEVRINVTGNIIRVYINDVFLHKEIFKGESPVFNLIQVTGILPKEGLYSVTINRS